jgi:hypothetical protein
MWGGGVVQSIDGAATDVWVRLDHFDVNGGGPDQSFTAGMAGVRIRF